MKRYSLIYYLVLFAAVLSSCNKEDYYLKDIKSNERTILNFKASEGQIGVMQIDSLDDTNLTITFWKTTDLSKVKPSIMVCYGATVSPASGQTVNFLNSDSTLTYTVTSQSGKTKQYKVKAQLFTFAYAGTWKVSLLNDDWWVGPGQSWGWGNHNDKVSNTIKDASAELDNVLQISLDSITPDGNVTGAYTFSSGDDGKFADFKYLNSLGTTIDFSYKFRKIKENTGTWFYDFSAQKFIFNKGTDSETSTNLVNLSSDKSTMTLTFNLVTDIDDPKWVTPEWGASTPWASGDFNFMGLCCVNKFWYVFKKQ